MKLKASGNFIWGEEGRRITHCSVPLTLCFSIVEKQAELPMRPSCPYKKALSYIWGINWKETLSSWFGGLFVYLFTFLIEDCNYNKFYTIYVLKICVKYLGSYLYIFPNIEIHIPKLIGRLLCKHYHTIRTVVYISHGYRRCDTSCALQKYVWIFRPKNNIH